MSNDFFRQKRTIFFFVFCGILVAAILFKYGNLAIQPVSAISQNKPIVERGSIVDRSGVPLAVQTNFYHVGVSLKTFKDSNKSKEEFAADIASALEMTETEVLTILNTTKNFV